MFLLYSIFLVFSKVFLKFRSALQSKAIQEKPLFSGRGVTLHLLGILSLFIARKKELGMLIVSEILGKKGGILSFQPVVTMFVCFSIVLPIFCWAMFFLDLICLDVSWTSIHFLPKRQAHTWPLLWRNSLAESPVFLVQQKLWGWKLNEHNGLRPQWHHGPLLLWCALFFLSHRFFWGVETARGSSLHCCTAPGVVLAHYNWYNLSEPSKVASKVIFGTMAKLAECLGKIWCFFEPLFFCPSETTGIKQKLDQTKPTTTSKII